MARKAQTQETEEAVLDADREVEMSREEEERSLNEEFENEFEVSKGVRPDGLGTSEEIAAARAPRFEDTADYGRAWPCVETASISRTAVSICWRPRAHATRTWNGASAFPGM
jgi:hypothetical protein